MRAENDFYPTPPWMVDVLFQRAEVRQLFAGGPRGRQMDIVEPCVGAGHLMRAVDRNVSEIDGAYLRWRTNDIDVRHDADSHEDALRLPWSRWLFDVAITNPPFAVDREPFASKLVMAALDSVAVFIMLARLTLLDPTSDRAIWLSECPPDSMIVLPRWSFNASGKTDSVTCAWFLWGLNLESRIQVQATRGDQAGLDLFSEKTASGA